MKKFESQLMDVLRNQSYSGDFAHISKFICRKITDLGLKYTKDAIGNIYVVKGISDVYPTMVSHIDTVHLYNKYYQVHKAGRNIFAIDRMNCERLGVGGDDKVGVFITLKMLEDMDVFKAVFFVDEEIGCVGSRACNFDFFSDSSFVLECDRKGNDDFVNSISGTKLYSDEFSESIAPILSIYSRKETSGGMTDVLEIAYSTDVCVANMSCGYYEPHSDGEFVNIDDVFDTYSMCRDMFDELGHKLWRVSEAREEYSYGGYYGSGYGTAYPSTHVYNKGYSSQSWDNTKQNKFDFDDWKADDIDDVEEVHVSTEHGCLICGSPHITVDELHKDIYCYSCGEWMTNTDYISALENLI